MGRVFSKTHDRPMTRWVLTYPYSPHNHQTFPIPTPSRDKCRGTLKNPPYAISTTSSPFPPLQSQPDFKNHQLPLARIKKITKADEDVRMIAAEAPILFAKACELFILELTIRSWLHAEENKRRTLQKNDIAAAITRTNIFDFLVDIVPREESREEPPPPPGIPVAAASGVPYYYPPGVMMGRPAVNPSMFVPPPSQAWQSVWQNPTAEDGGYGGSSATSGGQGNPDGQGDYEGYAEDLNDDDVFYASVAVPTLQFRNDVLEGKWIDDLHMAEVLTRKGKMWRSTGIVRNGKLYYSIEETLFLAEIGAFRILNDDGTPLPLKDIYIKLLKQKNGCSWESFEVYKQIKGLGYIIGHHNVQWSVKGATLVSTAEGFPDIIEKVDSKSRECSNITKMFSSIQINDVRPTFDVYPPNSNFKKSSPGRPSFVLCLARGLPPSKQEVEELEKRYGRCPLKFCNVDHGRVSLFSIDRVELPILP